MSQEGQLVDKKSLRTVSGRTADWDGLVKDCIAFANAQGGRLLIGIENDADVPAPSQQIDPGLPDTLRRKINERSMNVSTLPSIIRAANGGEFIELRIARSFAVASTTDGRFFLRVADESKPVVGDDIMRLAAERTVLPWETLTTHQVPRAQIDSRQFIAVLAALRASDRVKSSVKEKSDQELLDHYLLAQGDWLTNLGVLCVGRREDRAKLATAPVIQFIKYDELGQKVNKIVWDDFSLNPMEMIEAVWREVPDFRERYELPDGLYRQHVPAYDEVVVRELLVNALVHRPYTQRGDIFLNLHPDRLEAVNPGLLPLGVTPDNILHATVRRNENMARLFHDLKLMEREGSGFDKMYEVLLSQGRPVPETREQHDRVEVTIRRRILKPHVIDFIAKADQTYQLNQRERIALGLLAQHEALTARELTKSLELPSVEALQPWLKRLQEWNLVKSTGRTRATRYHIDPDVLRSLEFSGATTLKCVEPHRLRALVLEDLDRYPRSSIGEINRRVGEEIPYKRLKRALDELIAAGEVDWEGVKRWRRYALKR